MLLTFLINIIKGKKIEFKVDCQQLRRVHLLKNYNRYMNERNSKLILCNCRFLSLLLLFNLCIRICNLRIYKSFTIILSNYNEKEKLFSKKKKRK